MYTKPKTALESLLLAIENSNEIPAMKYDTITGDLTVEPIGIDAHFTIRGFFPQEANELMNDEQKPNDFAEKLKACDFLEGMILVRLPREEEILDRAFQL